MRVRRFELRLIAIALVAAWGAAAALIVVGYRPGGPLDLLVGLTMLAPLAIAVTGVIWPPVARGAIAFPLMISLGVGALLVLVPSIGSVFVRIATLGSQTLLPSLEAAYPWLLALVGTSLFSGFGLARRLQGATADRRARLLAGIALATALTFVGGGLFAGAAIANQEAMREAGRPPSFSRFGPTNVEGEPPACDGPLVAGAGARLDVRFSGEIDLRPMGSIEVTGIRRGRDIHWLAYVATDRELGLYGVAAVGGRGWVRTPRGRWEAVDPASLTGSTLDVQAVAVALKHDYRVTHEDHGIEVIEGARARRCRIAVDGATFRATFPQIRWLVGDADLERWRGQLDYWVFLDGELGQLSGSVNGEAIGIEEDALLATVTVVLGATLRDRDIVVYPPAP